MHAVGLHSALAIRRERKRRAEQQRARERRYSIQSTESGVTSPHCSTGSLERRRYRKNRTTENEVVSSVGMLHLGVVFLVLGVFLIASGLLPDDVTSWSSIGSVSWFNELVCSGLFALAIGIFLIVLHKYLTKSEEEALEDYVQRQLTRSRSGHRLERDAETGGMHTKNARRARATEVLPETITETYTQPSPDRAHGFVNALALNGDAMRESPLEQIVEEEISVASESDRKLGKFNKDTYSTPSVAASLSPGSPSDTRELLADGRYMIMSHMLQSLLQPRENQRSKMIGAMPAVAVRHERRRNEKRGGGAVGRRPSQLPLQLGRAPDADPTPSPVHHRLRNELYVCGKVAALHAVVGSLLLGIVVLVVGLVQLSPGAEAAQHRYYLMGAGAALVGAGVLGAVLRCICLHWYNRKFRQGDNEEQEPATHKNGVSVVESGHGHDKHDKGHDKNHDKGHDKAGHDKTGHDKAGHEKTGHDKAGHDNAGNDKTGHDKAGHDKTGHDKSHDKPDKHDKTHEKSDQNPKLKSQSSIGRDVDLMKQQSATSDT